MRDAQSLRPAAVRGRRPGRLDRRPAPFRRRPLSAGSSRTFDSALRSAVTRLRLTNLPVALTVSHGNHGWILTGFRATADPAKTTSFTVTSVRVTGPLYGLQSKNGYDMAPNTKLTTAQLKRFFTPWKYAPRRDDLGRPLRLDPAGAGQGRGGRSATRHPRGPPALHRASPRVRRRSCHRARVRRRCRAHRAAPAVALLASDHPDGSRAAVRTLDPVPATDASPAPLGIVDRRRPRAHRDRGSARAPAEAPTRPSCAPGPPTHGR